MTALARALEELVTANRILAREGVVDSFGHVSIRHPERPDRYILSRARAPECIEVEDLMEFMSDGAPVEGLEIIHADGTRIPITVSVGVSAMKPGSGDAGALIEAADLALYSAKRAGRNRCRDVGWAVGAPDSAQAEESPRGHRFARLARAGTGGRR